LDLVSRDREHHGMNCVYSTQAPPDAIEMMAYRLWSDGQLGCDLPARLPAASVCEDLALAARQ